MSKKNSQAGFSLIECMCAMLITIVGVLSVEVLIVHAIGLQDISRDATFANSLARAKVEDLRIVSPSAANSARALGGSLTANAANHFDTFGDRFLRRWLIETGPADTQKLTVVVVPNSPGMRLPNVRVETLLR